MTRIAVLFVLVFLGNLSFAQVSAGDPIKPLPQINKEFLVIAHILMDKDSVANISEAEINLAMGQVNSIFQPIGAKFTVCEFRYIYNYNYDILNEDLDKELRVKYLVEKRINIFFVMNITDKPACGYADLGGIDGYSSPAIIIKKQTCATPITIAHELGHYFSLEHPFETRNGLELADGSNCATAGDRICDTPADPYQKGEPEENYVTSSCIFYYQEKDSKGNYYDPDVTNIMGYYLKCACRRFTHQQYEKMANYYLSNKLVW
ncbi:MAG: zinc-dependent metalloprotease family protein [Cytophagaceae bacterium]